MTQWVRVIGLLLALVAGQACSRPTESQPPVATPAFSASRTRAPLGSPLEVTYRFRVAPSATFDRDYRVLVHFVDLDGELMWTDDHDPPTPTTQWKPGETVEYQRTTFIPVYPYIGEATVKMGLYAPEGQRLTLDGEDQGQRSYKVSTLQILPQSENVFLIYKSGWHPAEVSQQNPAVEWQWTQREAVIAFKNPHSDATFFLHLDGRPDVFDSPQQIAIRLGETVVETFSLVDRNPVIRRIGLAAADLERAQRGTSDMVELAIAVDKTFIPAQTPAANSGADSRELGVRVFHAFVQPE